MERGGKRQLVVRIKIYLLMNTRSSGHVGRLYKCYRARLTLPCKNYLIEYFCFSRNSLLRGLETGGLVTLEFKINTNE